MVSLDDQVTDTAKITKVCGLHSEENDKCHLKVCENKDVIFPIQINHPLNSLIHFADSWNPWRGTGTWKHPMEEKQGVIFKTHF